MKAHDVRHLRVCASCGGIGDGRGMLTIGLHRTLAMGQHHDACVVARLSESEVLALPERERAKITIGAAGVPLMQKLMDGR